MSWIHGLFENSYTMLMGEIRMPGLHIFIPNELPLVERVMNEAKAFPKHAMMVEVLEPAIGISTFTANGEDWEQQRAMINPAFQHTALAKTLPLMCDAARALIERIGTDGGERVIDIDPLMTHVAADIIFRTLFSVPLDAAGSAVIHRRFNRFQRFAQSGAVFRLYGLPTFGYKGRSEREARGIHEVFAGIVQDRYRRFHGAGEVVHRDILQSLFEARHPVSGAPFTVRQVMEQVSLIFLAGHETSASLMSWATYLLAECGALQQRMRDEVVHLTGERGFTMDALKAMTLTRNVVRETLRLYPPVAFLPRDTVCPVTMRGKPIAPGDMLVISPWLVQRNARNWRDPHAFDPDRFEEPDGQEMLKKAWLPFGKGPRLCIGAGFAQQEAMVVLAHLVRHFCLASPAGDKPEPVSRLTLRPRNGIRIALKPIGG
ncbi:MAG: cytochrome P450 [Novosphingobium sp.]|nr:cytochrome P450 [Novosphingobium sp.]